MAKQLKLESFKKVFLFKSVRQERKEHGHPNQRIVLREFELVAAPK